MSFANQGFVGVQRCTTAAGEVVGVAGKPTRVYHMNILSGAAAGEVKLYNVSAVAGIAAGKLYVQQLCTVVSSGNDFNYGQEGFLFPDGCVYEEAVDANVTATTITFSQEK